MTAILSAYMFNRGAKKDSAVILKNLNISPGMVVADIGSGGGHYTRAFSEAVGDTGRVYAIDVDTELLSHVQAIAEKHRNIQTIIAEKNGFVLPETCDLMFMRNAFHHLEDADSYFRGVSAFLKPAGRIVIIEKRPEGKGFHNTPEEIIIRTLKAAGYHLACSYSSLPRYSFNIFDK